MKQGRGTWFGTVIMMIAAFVAYQIFHINFAGLIAPMIILARFLTEYYAEEIEALGFWLKRRVRNIEGVPA